MDSDPKPHPLARLLPVLVAGLLGLWVAGCDGPVGSGGVAVADDGGQTVEPPRAQGADPRSVETTQQIRSRLMAQDHLSFDAKHIRVLSNRGCVVLDGSVASDAEKDQVLRIARSAAQDWEIADQLAVGPD